MKRAQNPPPSIVISIAKTQHPKRPRHLKSAIDAAQKELSATGQLIPIIVSAEPQGSKKELYTICEGDLIVEAARVLKWRKIKAIVLAYECPSPKAIPDWVDILKRYLAMDMTDYELAESAAMMEEKWDVRGNEFAAVVGLSKPYVYNLIRWYRHVPKEVRAAWQAQHPLVSQAELERYSHMTNEEALKAWRVRTKMLGGRKPFKPHHKNGSNPTPPQRKPRRASVQQIAGLQEEIDQSKLAPEVKILCTNILKFVLGAQKNVPGLTDYKKIPQKLIEDKANA